MFFNFHAYHLCVDDIKNIKNSQNFVLELKFEMIAFF